ncbi:lactate utilization protein C [Trinickia sp. EG282A]|uniref:lactate utilization protein C n=1 Tax=Trinickia sp. EG282A TaxID=3237013 RepID=UPI0034D34C69
MSALTARERILGRLRAAASQPEIQVTEIDKRIDAHYGERRRAAGPTSKRELVEAMHSSLKTAHADVWCSSATSWPAEIARRLAENRVRRLLVDKGSREGAALAHALPPTVEALSYDRPIEAWKRELFETVDAGFTVARSGIAATGTLVVAPDAGSPRTASLAPPLHIALVHERTLHPDLHAAAQAERWHEGMPTNLVLVSGPSKTSDIQQTLAYGAHGPRWLWVVIVTESVDREGDHR